MKMNWNKWVLCVFLFLGAPVLAQSLARQGWPESLKDLYFHTQSTQKNYVLLVSRLPSIVIDFRSNQGIRNSINSFNFQKDYHPGHEMIGWACKMNGINYNSFIAFTGETNNQANNLIENGWGLTGLLATFTDGYIQTPKDLEDRFKFFNEEFEKDPKGPLYLMANLFEITEKDCESLIREVYRYTNHPEKPTTKFGLLLDPNNYQGAGCGSFVIHLLEKVAQFKDIAADFRRSFKLPYYLFGTGDFIPDHVEIPSQIQQVQVSKKVSKFSLISYDWSSSKDLNLDASMIDPELIIQWQKKYFEAYYQDNKSSPIYDYNFFRKKTKRSHWELINDIYDNAQPQSKYFEIDDNYDLSSKKVSLRAMNNLKGKKLTLFKFLNFPGIIVENK